MTDANTRRSQLRLNGSGPAVAAQSAIPYESAYLVISPRHGQSASGAASTPDVWTPPEHPAATLASGSPDFEMTGNQSRSNFLVGHSNARTPCCSHTSRDIHVDRAQACERLPSLPSALFVELAVVGLLSDADSIARVQQQKSRCEFGD
jgi:hypothetical protein